MVKIKRSRKVVVIAASAGGIDALKEVVSHLPHNLEATVILIQHLTPDHETRLHEYLAPRSKLPVRLAGDMMPLEEGVIYVSVPGVHLRLRDGHLLLDRGNRGKAVNYVWPSADVLFSSAAREYGARVIGVVLTGTGRDGAKGCQKIKAEGGLTIAQDEKSSHSFGMPRSAIEAGAIDYILALDKIAEKIVSLTRRETRKKKREVHDG